MKYLLPVILFVFAVLVCGVIGWLIGASVGGNIDGTFTYRGLPGYEGTGLLGSHIGIALSALGIGIVLRMRRYK